MTTLFKHTLVNWRALASCIVGLGTLAVICVAQPVAAQSNARPQISLDPEYKDACIKRFNWTMSDGSQAPGFTVWFNALNWDGPPGSQPSPIQVDLSGGSSGSFLVEAGKQSQKYRFSVQVQGQTRWWNFDFTNSSAQCSQVKAPAVEEIIASPFEGETGKLSCLPTVTWKVDERLEHSLSEVKLFVSRFGGSAGEKIVEKTLGKDSTSDDLPMLEENSKYNIWVQPIYSIPSSGSNARQEAEGAWKKLEVATNEKFTTPGCSKTPLPSIAEIPSAVTDCAHSFSWTIPNSEVARPAKKYEVSLVQLSEDNAPIADTRKTTLIDGGVLGKAEAIGLEASNSYQFAVRSCDTSDCQGNTSEWSTANFVTTPSDQFSCLALQVPSTALSVVSEPCSMTISGSVPSNARQADILMGQAASDSWPPRDQVKLVIASSKEGVAARTLVESVSDNAFSTSIPLSDTAATYRISATLCGGTSCSMSAGSADANVVSHESAGAPIGSCQQRDVVAGSPVYRTCNFSDVINAPLGDLSCDGTTRKRVVDLQHLLPEAVMQALGIDLQLVYRGDTQKSYVTPLGKGWALSIEERVRILDNEEGHGVVIDAMGVPTSLVRNADSSWHLLGDNPRDSFILSANGQQIEFQSVTGEHRRTYKKVADNEFVLIGIQTTNAFGETSSISLPSSSSNRARLVAATVGGATVTVQFRNLREKITASSSSSADTTTFTTNKAGDLISAANSVGGEATTTSFDYNKEGRLSKVSSADGGVRYLFYNGLGALYQEASTKFGITTYRRYERDEHVSILEVTTPTKLVHQYTYLDGILFSTRSFHQDAREQYERHTNVVRYSYTPINDKHSALTRVLSQMQQGQFAIDYIYDPETELVIQEAEYDTNSQLIGYKNTTLTQNNLLDSVVSIARNPENGEEETVASTKFEYTSGATTYTSKSIDELTSSEDRYSYTPDGMTIKRVIADTVLAEETYERTADKDGQRVTRTTGYKDYVTPSESYTVTYDANDSPTIHRAD